MNLNDFDDFGNRQNRQNQFGRDLYTQFNFGDFDNCRNSQNAFIKVRSSMRDPDLNERPGEAPPQSKLENPGETKTKQKRSPSTHRVEPRKVLLIKVKEFNERPGPQ